MPYTIAQALTWARDCFQQSDSAAVDARVLLCHVIAQSQSYLFTWPDKVLTEQQQAMFSQLVEQRQSGHPVAHLTGERDFWTLRLAVNPATLIPRPETECLVEAALELLTPTDKTVCDLGTGTGAVALAIASERKDIEVTGVDRIEDAVTLATQNARTNNVANSRFVVSNWFNALADSQFDMIVSNPPYVEADSEYLQQGDVRFEPLSALTAGADGLDDIKIIIAHAVTHLREGGWLLLEHGYTQASSIQSLFELHGFAEIHTRQDLAGLDRITAGKRVACD